VGAFVRLGWRERAGRLAEWFVTQQRPEGWRQWPEVVFRDSQPVRFLGDLPHTWVGSDWVRSFLDRLVYPREADDALVIGAGVPPAWLEPPGVEVRDLPTPHGPVTFSMVREEGGVTVRIAGDLRVPAGGIVVVAPEGSVLVRRIPATVRIPPAAAAPEGRAAQ
ncbi:MAG TPA: coagulation factor 5/8 type domain-containing protein, partial [bacterium]|nr:coagulation factor 5/8 type domain-containing protein [bacterium]